MPVAAISEFRHFCRRCRVAGVVYSETRANLSRANFSVRDTGTSPAMTVCDS